MTELTTPTGDRVVLVAIHDSAAAFVAAERGVSLARELGARVHAVEVSEAEGTVDGALRRLRRIAEEQGVPMTTEVREAPVVSAILDAARESGAELIVMARVDRPGHSIPGIGSRTLRVLEFAEVPVVVVPVSQAPGE